MNEERLRKSILFYIGGISRSLRYNTEQRLAEYGITQPQGLLLGAIYDSLKSGREINRKYLQAAVNLSGPSVTSLLDGLEKKNFIKRCISKEDNRALDITVTAEGAEINEKATSVLTEHEQQLLSGLTHDEVATFCNLLERAYQNVQ